MGGLTTLNGGITNSGVISAQDGLLVVNVASLGGNISNTGTISAGTIGIFVGSGVTFGPGNAILNTGTIIGGVDAIDLKVATSAITIDQMGGLISGAIKLSANADVLNIFGGTVAGNIVGQGSRQHGQLQSRQRNVHLRHGLWLLRRQSGQHQFRHRGAQRHQQRHQCRRLWRHLGRHRQHCPGHDDNSHRRNIRTGHARCGRHVDGDQRQSRLPARRHVSGQYQSDRGFARQCDGQRFPQWNGGSRHRAGKLQFQDYLRHSPRGEHQRHLRWLYGRECAGLQRHTDLSTQRRAAEPDGEFGANAGVAPNQRNVANPINNAFNNGGGLPPGFQNLFNLSGPQLANSLTQIDGEAATGAERGAFQSMTQFLGVMLDPFVDGRLGGFGTAGGSAIGFAPEQKDNLPPDIALAYASVLSKAPPRLHSMDAGPPGVPPSGVNNTNGNAASGSRNVATSRSDFAGGMDDHVSLIKIVGLRSPWRHQLGAVQWLGHRLGGDPPSGTLASAKLRVGARPIWPACSPSPMNGR